MIAFNVPVKRTAEQVDEKQDRCYLREWWKLKPEASLGGERSGRLHPAARSSSSQALSLTSKVGTLLGGRGRGGGEASDVTGQQG